MSAADTLILTSVSEATANAAMRTIAQNAHDTADFLHLLDVVRPAPFGGDAPDAPRGAKPRWGL